MQVAAKDDRKPSGRLDRSSSDPFWPVQGFRPPNQSVFIVFLIMSMNILDGFELVRSKLRLLAVIHEAASLARRAIITFLSSRVAASSFTFKC